jgi:predicted transcriptional regulator
MKTAFFKIEPVAQGLARFRETFDAVLAGRRVEPRDIVAFTSLEAARNFLTRERLALLRVISDRRPSSIYELAKMIGRDLKNVQEDIRILEREGLIRTKERPRGKRSVKVLEVPYDQIQLTIGLRAGADGTPNKTAENEQTPLKGPEEVESAAPASVGNARQEELYENLLMIGEGPAAFYRDACQIMAEPQRLKSSTHVVGHLVREIESALRSALETLAEPQPSSIGPDKRGSNNSEGHASNIKRIAKGLRLNADDPAVIAWLKLADSSYEFAPHRLAHRDALGMPRPISRDFVAWWDQIQSILRVVVAGLRERFLEPLREIDRLIAIPHPSAKEAEFLRNKIPNNRIFLGHFFDKCQNAEWLAHLANVGFFRNAPKDGRWAEAGYLARMARHESMAELVCRTIGDIAETENRLVHAELLEGIVGLPAEFAASLIDKIETWAKSETNGFLLPDFGRLIRKLATGGEEDAALRLARLLLAVMPGPVDEPEGADVLAPIPRTRTDLWNYEQVLKDDLPALGKVSGLETLKLLCSLLGSAIRFSLRKPEESAPNDVSMVWRPVIEENEQNLEPDLRSILARTIRDTALDMVNAGRTTVAEVIRTLEEQDPPWCIFARLCMYLLTQIEDAPRDLVYRFLLDREIFDAPDCRHEYARLLNSCSPQLEPDALRQILGFVEEAPEPEVFKRNLALWGQTLSDDQALRHRRRWQYDHLAFFRSGLLPGDWQRRYEQLVNEFGEPEHPDFARYVTQYVGPTAPKSSDELRKMEVSSLVDYLREWQPENRFMGASREGMAREVSAIIGEEPQRFAAEAEAFRGLHPTYVRCLINGLSGALGKKAKFDWAPVLRLCKWVLTQEDWKVSKDVPYWADEDKDWSWTRRAISHLLESALSRGSEDLDLSLRTDVWDVLSKLTEDAEPTPDREVPKKGHDRDPVHIAINSARGTAMLAVTYYATWLRQHVERQRDLTSRAVRGFDEMPEVREVLERRLDLSVEPTRAIRSVYGMRLPWIRLIDPEWTEQNLDKIFPESENERAFWEAAWFAYLTHCPAYDDVLDTLRKKYSLAIERLGEDSVLGKKPQDLETPLAVHVMSFYLRGKLEISSSDGVIERFFARASDRARGWALESTGRWLWQVKSKKEPVSPEVLERLKRLWEWRCSEFSRSDDPGAFAREAAAFVWWFRSRAFEDSWAVSQLNRALMSAVHGDPNVLRDAPYVTLETLAALCKEFPLDTVRCLQQLLTRADQWHVGAFEKDIRKVLSQALISSVEAKTVAEQSIVALGRRGLLQFRDLLS